MKCSSLSALSVDFTTPNIMKIRETIKGREVVAMINCGATYNFIAHKLVEELDLPQIETINYGVIMQSKVAVRGKYMCGE